MITRDTRQKQCEETYLASKGCGTLELCPAFGKTRVAINIIKYFLRSNKDRQVIVIVPQSFLKDQWETILSENELTANVNVFIINTAIKTNRTCDLLVLDEIHRMAATTFSQIFDKITYRFILGLTATIKRLDSKHKMLEELCPIIDTITTTEARANGWIADYQEFNLAVHMTEEEEVKYKKLEEDFDTHMNTFMHDFMLMMRCVKSYRPIAAKKPSGVEYEDSECAKLARLYGWTGNNAYVAYEAMTRKSVNLWGGSMSHNYHPKKLYIRAINGMRTLRSMKSFIQKHPGKTKAVIELCKRIPVKTITFSELTTIADQITAATPSTSVSYHSAIKPHIVDGKRLNKKATLKYIADLVYKNHYTHVNTAKALDEGADFPDIQLGIRHSGSSSPTQQTQRRGRIIRKHLDKKAVFISLYIPNTKEQQWLAKAQRYETEIIYVESIEEILEQIKI